jgi:hypothetical protein
VQARTASIAALVLLMTLPASVGCGRKGRQTADEQRAEIAALEKERETLRARLDALSGNDPRAVGMPDASVRIGVPTTLAEDLIERVATGFVDRITIELRNLKVRKHGQVRKVITLGDYDLQVTVNRVTARLKSGKPAVTFGGNRIAIAMPVGVVSGDWRSTVNFVWDGRNIGGAVCGDQTITQQVRGGVWPDRYAVGGVLSLSATPQQILAEPVFPLIQVRLRVKPSDESWAAAQKLLDDKKGVCGFVLDRVDVMGSVKRLIDKGFTIRLPTEKIKPLALPVGVNPSMIVRGQRVGMNINVSDLAITREMIWLGADVVVAIGKEAAAKLPAARTAKPSKD